MISGFICIIAQFNTFAFIAELYSIIWVGYVLLIYSSIDGHWGCFYFLNSAVMNMHVCKCLDGEHLTLETVNDGTCKGRTIVEQL